MSTNVVYLRPEHVMAMTKEPAIYAAFPFLEPMRESALKVHNQLAKLNCKGCTATARNKATAMIAGALVALVDNESRRQPNCLADFRAQICKTLQLSADELRLSWAKDGKTGTIRF